MKPKTLLTLKTPRKKKPFPIKSCSPNENYPYITYTENIKKPFRLFNILFINKSIFKFLRFISFNIILLYH